MDGVTRAWDEWLAAVEDFFGLDVPTLAFYSVLAAAVVALLWYFFPYGLPWHWGGSGRGGADKARDRRRSRRPGLGRLRWRLRRRRSGASDEEPEVLRGDEVPDLPAAVLALTADQLAAAGRYAEAVRERLRAMLRELIERGLLPASPGWTVMELAAAGARTRPALAGPLGAAAGIFSEIWYGLRPATADDDAAMRTHAAAVTAVAEESEPTPVRTA